MMLFHAAPAAFRNQCSYLGSCHPVSVAVTATCLCSVEKLFALFSLVGCIHIRAGSLVYSEYNVHVSVIQWLALTVLPWLFSMSIVFVIAHATKHNLSASFPSVTRLSLSGSGSASLVKCVSVVSSCRAPFRDRWLCHGASAPHDDDSPPIYSHCREIIHRQPCLRQHWLPFFPVAIFFWILCSDSADIILRNPR